MWIICSDDNETVDAWKALMAILFYHFKSVTNCLFFNIKTDTTEVSFKNLHIIKMCIFRPTFILRLNYNFIMIYKSLVLISLVFSRDSPQQIHKNEWVLELPSETACHRVFRLLKVDYVYLWVLCGGHCVGWGGVRGYLAVTAFPAPSLSRMPLRLHCQNGNL